MQMFIADFHIHSKYSRATSKDCVPEALDFWGRRKGIGVIGTGDFTHQTWREELKEKLVPSGAGLYALKDDFRREDKVAGADFRPQFVVSGEISSIYKKNGRVRKVHNLILLPGLEDADLIARKLETIGNLRSDGRPILGLDSRDLLEIVLDKCPEAIFIPAHIWTPHFSLFGAYSGFDRIEECFEDLTGFIYALETGLSSDPPMNWRLSALDRFTLVSNSDAHSPGNLGREANIFRSELSYQGLLKALKDRESKEFYGTIEFFPEEGKYHYDCHRACKVCWKPADTIAAEGRCPVCGGRITVGVLHRVEALADRAEGFVPPGARHFESLVPLAEVIASSIGSAVTSRKVKEKYEDLLRNIGPELFILREAGLKDLESAAGPLIAEGVRRLRCGKVEIQPGFDGEYGKIKIMDKSEIELLSGQICLFNDNKNNPDSKSVETIPEPPAGNKGPGREAGQPPASAGTDLLKSDKKRAETVPGERPYGLNEEQWAAVSSTGPALAVIAGPGTGKTKTLVSRIAYLVEKCGIHPSQVTAVTFTNKAAEEMRLRLEKHFGAKRTAGAMAIGTFHAICLQILAKGRGENNAAILDEYQAAAIMEAILKDRGLGISARDALREISLMKNGIPSLGAKKKSALPAGVYDAYCFRLKDYGVMDYDDILLEALRQFEGGKAGEPAGRGRENTFSYLLVDEFQDINEIQYRLIKAWGQNSEGVFLIGDPDQSIYGFRGADYRYFARAKEDFPGLRQVRLTQNYRSTPEVIACAKEVINKKTGEEHACSLEARRERGIGVRLIETRDEFSEALFVAKEINRMVGGIDMLDIQTLSSAQRKRSEAKQPRGFSDIALLYRTNHQARILEQCLLKEGVPYVVAGREEFLAEKLVRQALAFFRFLLNPGDMASLLFCLQEEKNAPADLAQKVLAGYAAGKKNLASFIKSMEEAQLPPEQEEQPRNFPGGNFLEMVKKYAAVIHKEKAWKVIDVWIQDHGLSGSDSLAMLLHTAVMYDKMPSLLQNLVLGRESDVVRSGGKVYSPDAVSLMTIHAAKGLEFPVVFICGVNEGRIPLRSSRPDFNLDEERRLFYVGMTRARDELLLLTSPDPSLFLADIPEEQLTRETAFTPKQAPLYKQASLFD